MILVSYILAVVAALIVVIALIKGGKDGDDKFPDGMA